MFILYYVDEDGGGWFDIQPIGVSGDRERLEDIRKKMLEESDASQKQIKENRDIWNIKYKSCETEVRSFLERNKHIIRENRKRGWLENAWGDAEREDWHTAPDPYGNSKPYRTDVIEKEKQKIIDDIVKEYTPTFAHPNVDFHLRDKLDFSKLTEPLLRIELPSLNDVHKEVGPIYYEGGFRLEEVKVV